MTVAPVVAREKHGGRDEGFQGEAFRQRRAKSVRREAIALFVTEAVTREKEEFQVSEKHFAFRIQTTAERERLVKNASRTTVWREYQKVHAQTIAGSDLDTITSYMFSPSPEEDGFDVTVRCNQRTLYFITDSCRAREKLSRV